MRKNMQPVFEASWWVQNQPKGLTKANALRDALKDYESAQAALKKSGVANDLKGATTALDKVKPAVDAVVAEAEKAVKSPPKGADKADLEATVDVLKKFARAYDGEKTELQKLVKEDDEDGDDVFGDPVKFKKYLLTGLRKVASGDGYHFGAVLGKKATDHRMAISKTKGAQGLLRSLRETTGLRLGAFGTVAPSADDGAVLALSLEAAPPPGLKKKLDRMLKVFKPLPFHAVIMLIDGAAVEDVVDPDDEDTEEANETEGEEQTTGQTQSSSNANEALAARLRQGMEQVVPLLRQAIAANPNRQAELMAPVGAFRQQMDAQDYAGAQRSLTALVALLRGSANSSSSGATQDAAVYDKLVSGWTATRNQAAADLDKLKAAILDEFKAEPEFASIQQGVTRLDNILGTLGTGLEAKLNAARAATDPNARAGLKKEALDEVARYRDFVSSDALVAAVENNPFTPVPLKQAISRSLDEIKTALAA